MILKYFEINKIDLEKNKFLLFYGKNEGFKNDTIEILTRKKEGVLNYDEKEILGNEEAFLENILSKSLFVKNPTTASKSFAENSNVLLK